MPKVNTVGCGPTLLVNMSATERLAGLFMDVYMIRTNDLKLVQERPAGRPLKQPEETTRQLNQAFRSATESEKKASKKRGNKK